MLLSVRKPYGILDDYFSFGENFNRLFNNYFYYNESPSDFSTMILRSELIDKGDNLLFKIEIPGATKDKIKLSLHNNSLTVSGERKVPEISENRSWVRNERMFGSFSRTFQIPSDIDASKVSAEFKDGILKVNLHKSEKVKPKEITIK